MLDGIEFPVLVGSATTGVGVDRLADFICELGPSPADRPTTVARRHRRRRASSVEVAADPAGQAAGLRVQDRRRPVRRPGLAVQGAVGHDRRRRPAGQHDQRHRGAPARPVPPPRQGAPHGRQGRRRRHRRRRQAQRHGDRLDAGAEGLAGAGRRRRAPPIAVVRPGPAAAHAVRRRQAVGRAATPAVRGPGARRRAQRGDRPDRAARHGRHPPRRGARAAGPQVRRQRRDRGRAGALPRDDHRLGRGRGQDQEAVRRARPVRRRPPAGQPDGAGRRHRVRQLDRRRHDPQAVHPRRPARRRGDDGHGRRARLPGRRRARRVLRRQVPLRRLVRHGVPLGRRPRVEGGAAEGRRGRARADLAAHRHRAGGLPGRRARRPQRPPRPGQRHVRARQRRPRDRRPRAGRRDPALRRRAALDDRRPRHVRRRPRPLRPAPDPPHRQDQADPAAANGNH